MARAVVNGIEVNYATEGSGPPLLLCAPGGFDASIEKWSTNPVWQRVRPIETFAARFTCVAYDRRESGHSGGRVEPLLWRVYAAEAKGLLDHLRIDRAFVLGACMGCSVALALAVAYPQAVRGLVLHWPTGGREWRRITHERWLGVHAAYVREQGLGAAVARAREAGSFMKEFRAGPWASVIARDPDFAREFAAMDADRYLALLEASAARLYDRDTAPGAEPAELKALRAPTFIVPGDDQYHATSAALYLRDLIADAEYWDCPAAQQRPEDLRERILSFLSRHSRDDA